MAAAVFFLALAWAGEARASGEDVVPQDDPGVGNQAVWLTNADTWHRAGYLGQGIKVGVIDIGFAKFAELQDAGELPEEVTIRCNGWTRNTTDMSDCGNWFDTATHGTAVAESLMDIAPKATLYVGELEAGSRKFPIVEWMIEEGVDVINYSITNGFEGPGDGTSPYWDSVYAAIDLAVESGAVWVSIAGNGAENTWYGAFQRTEVTDDEGNTTVVHNFGTADDPDVGNDIQLEPGERIFARLRWEEDWSDVQCDLGIYLYDVSTGLPLADSLHDIQFGYNEFSYDAMLWERKAENPNADYEIRVQVDEGCEDDPEWIQLISYAEKGLKPASEGGHLVTPADSTNPGMLTVGAAPHYDTMTVEPYSNRGPTVDGRVKPDVVGVDCARITTREPFARGEEQCWMRGTSQASPHVAGLVALVRQRFAGDEAYDTPAEIVSYIQDSAIQRDITPDDPDTMPDPNNVWGHGFAVLEALDVIEYDVDDDGLIEISTLAHLDAVRYDLDGDGIVDPASRTGYLGAFTKAVDGMGCPPTTGCTGYELTGDLDFDSDGDGDVDGDDHDGAWWNSGRGWEPIGDGLGGPSRNYRPGGYRGVFEGNGHTVSNLLIANRIPTGTTDDREPTGYFGLFGEILPGGEVRNLNVAGVSVSVQGPAGWYTSDGYFNHGGYYAGGLAGENHGTITNVHVTGTVTADGTYDDAGGLGGRNTGNITDSSAEVTVTAGDDAGGLVGESYSHRATINRSSADSTVTGESAGGLVGTATNITITNSYAHGSATGDDAAGLVAAAWFSTITNSYATTAITGTRDTGGLVADGDLNTITNSYWDSTTTGHASSLGSPDTAAKTTTELQQDTETAVDAADYTGIYSGWPKTTWDFGLNCHYPTIQTDTDTQPAICPSTNTDITDTDKAEGAAASSIDDDHNQEPETDDDRDQEPEQITETDPTPQKPAPVVIAPVFRAPPPSSSNPSPAPDKTNENPADDETDELFYSGNVTGPDFCVNRSLGGATTNPFDSDGDGIADTCSLPRTRRAAIARQQALEALAGLPPNVFDTLFAQQCREVQETYGEPAQEATDECAPHRSGSSVPTAPKPDPAEPGPEFYSGVITGPDFCVNRSLGGLTTYPFDSNGDGVADTCSLPRTRRAAIARQQTLEILAANNTHLFETLFAQQCREVQETYGEPAQEATDECAPHRTQPTPT